MLLQNSFLINVKRKVGYTRGGYRLMGERKNLIKRDISKGGKAQEESSVFFDISCDPPRSLMGGVIKQSAFHG